MLSYNWGSQQAILAIRDALRARGYVVWMDLEQMHGSILERMAEAIEKAAVVCVAMSSAYKQSPNCRIEGEYALQKRKRIIPLLLDKDYRPDGWLGAMLGMKLWFDFSEAAPSTVEFERSIEGLVSELGAVAGGSPSPIVSSTRNTGACPSCGMPSNDGDGRPSAPSQPQTVAVSRNEETTDVDATTNVDAILRQLRLIELGQRNILERLNQLEARPKRECSCIVS
mmetsp:Transcript_26595/g.63231  ORF Transcript_26595/g.63231 Transcript_26595/m.63231 type:complete len:226 (-) Transcript_26595:2102-2779(-)